MPGAKSETIVSHDEGPRADTSLEGLAKLRPSFGKTGTVTAGNASQISDGAAAVVVVSEADRPRQPLAAQGPDRGQRPPAAWRRRRSSSRRSRAVEKVLAKAKLTLADIDLVELNEAFAAQCLACMRPLEADPAKTNVHGGAIALGHPIGASGARVLVTLLYALAERGLKRGLASLCLGGGNAVAMIIERE